MRSGPVRSGRHCCRRRAAEPQRSHGLDYAYGPVPALDTAQLDAAHGSELIDSVAQLAKYRLILDRMQEVTLKTGASRDLIHRIAQDT